MAAIRQILRQTYDSLRRTGYVLGGLILASLVLSILSGVVLSFFYLPFPGLAYESIAAMAGNPVVSYFRNIHYWSSDLLFVFLILHMTRVVLGKVTDTNKRVAYWVGLLMAFLIANEMLFGTFMRSDQEAYEAYAHFWVGAKGVLPAPLQPIIGPVVDFIGKGETALLRFFVTHALIIPAALFILIFLHSVYAASFKGLVTQTTMGLKKYGPGPAETKPKKGLFSFPQLRILGKATLVTYAVIFALSYLLPAPFLGRAYGGLEITKPPWYLMWIYGLENMFGLAAIVYAPLVLLVIFFVVPFFSSAKKRLDGAIVLYLAAIAAIVLLGSYALLGKPVSHLEHFHEEDTPHQQHESVSGE